MTCNKSEIFSVAELRFLSHSIQWISNGGTARDTGNIWLSENLSMYYCYLDGQDNANQPPNREESLLTKNYKVNSD